MESQMSKPSECILRAHQIAEQRGLVFICISPGNSYYNKENVHKAIQFAKEKFGQHIYFIPEHTSIHSYMAVGYTEAEALKASEKRCKILRKYCENEAKSIFDEREFINRPQFLVQLQKIKALCKQTPEFRRDVEEQTMGALESKLKASDKKYEITNLQEGFNYIFKEMAFLTTLAQRKKVACIYHTRWPVMENFINGVYDGVPKKNIGFMTYTD